MLLAVPDELQPAPHLPGALHVGHALLQGSRQAQGRALGRRRALALVQVQGQRQALAPQLLHVRHPAAAAAQQQQVEEGAGRGCCAEYWYQRLIQEQAIRDQVGAGGAADQ